MTHELRNNPGWVWAPNSIENCPEIMGLVQLAEMVIFAMTNEGNRCWPTPKSWTKKERDETLLATAKTALANIRK